MLVLLVPIGLYAFVQVGSLRALTGKWKIAAMIPIPLMAAVAVMVVMAFFQGSNVWPLPLIGASLYMVVYLGALRGIRSLVVGRRS